MHLIYRQATLVYVWLGPDLSGQVKLASEFMRALLQRFDMDDPSERIIKYKKGMLSSWDKLEAAGLPPIRGPIWRHVFDFWERGWFSHI